MAKADKGIMIFKDTFEYLMEGMITEEQFGKLMKLVYQTRWEDGVDESTIVDKEVRLIWKTLKHTVLKSKTNSKQYKKSADLTPNTEFDTSVPPKKEMLLEVKEMSKNEVLTEVQRDDEEEPNISREIPIKDMVKQMFVPIYNDFRQTNNVEDFGKAIDYSISKLIVEYDDVDRSEIKEMFRQEYMRMKDAA